ncbi:carnitine O-acetyltransferase [Pseudonocardia eucalypti]|nr:carnitine O-acetyltransferase [Pseudonocardia eucalypti]
MSSEQDSTRTFDHEHQLPRVPLPSLEDNCARFLAWCAPLLTPEQLADTEAAVAEFQAPGGPGPRLHAALAEYDARPDVHSWLDTFWPYRYLGRRDRIALNANFFFLFRDEPGVTGQFDRAARLVTDAVALKLRLDDEKVPVVTLRGQPQTMEQYKYLFSTTRIPGAEQDTVRAPYYVTRPGPSTARHILVFAGGRMTRLDVVAPDGRPYAEAEIAAALHKLTQSERAPEEPVGQLTTMARAEWAARRAELLALDPANAEALYTVQDALFCLCLDDLAPDSDLAACDRLLHGDSANRWFDKAVTLIVFADGRAGINIEHCELDGTTVLAFVDTILGERQPAAETAEGGPTFGPVEFVLDDGLREAVRKAADSFAAFAGDTVSTVLSFTEFGADVAKGLGMSPDAFAQAAYQLAHRRARGHLGATYESIATRHWRHGRTEAMRVVTPEMRRFTEAMTDPGASAAEKVEAFRAAATAHVTRAKECQRGDAPEQHLWELQLIARRRGDTEPLALFESPGWLVMRDDWLSTSSAPSVNVSYFGFGSTAAQCIGVAYVLLPDRLNIYLSTPRPVADEMHAFATELRHALTELTELLSPSGAQ